MSPSTCSASHAHTDGSPERLALRTELERGARPPNRIGARGFQPSVNRMPPLAGITVVSVEQAVAAPFATRQLADLGARVIKIERPDGGDFARSYDHTVNGLASYFVWTNRSKESLTLDLKHPEAGAILDGLLAGADVFVQNLAPGAAS